MSYVNAIRVLGELSLDSNISLRVFLNTIKSTFDDSYDLAIFVSNLDILYYDIRDLDKLVIAIVDSEGMYPNLSERVKVFKEVLSVDFNTEFRVSYKALTIPMFEVWSSTKQKDVWIDRTKFNFNEEDKGKQILIPYDYYLLDKPVLFAEPETELKSNLGEIIRVGSLKSVSNSLPYIHYTI